MFKLNRLTTRRTIGLSRYRVRESTYLICLIAGILLNPLEAQATVSWTFNSSNCISGSGDGCGSSNLGPSQSFNSNSSSSSAVNVKVEAYSTTADSSGGVDKFQTGTLGMWSGGLGVQNQEDGSFGSSPHHAFDNDGGTNGNPDEAPDGDVDAGLFLFDQAVTLKDITIGWKSGDADISVMAYTGQAGDPADKAALDGTVRNTLTSPANTFQGLLSSGWSLVGHYADLVTNRAKAINGGNLSSSYWLISAFTSSASPSGTTAVPSGGGVLSFGNDYFKIKNLSGALPPTTTTSNSVPEPSSLALLAIGLLLVFRSRINNAVHTKPVKL